MTYNSIRIAFNCSRNLHKLSGLEKDIQICEKVCYRMAELGITGVSGLYEQGMDALMQIQYCKAINEGAAFISQLEIYIADIRQLHKSRLPRRNLARMRNPKLVSKAKEIAAQYHPNWQNCSPYARKLLSRNAHIIFGYNLDNPVNAVIT